MRIARIVPLLVVGIGVGAWLCMRPAELSSPGTAPFHILAPAPMAEPAAPSASGAVRGESADERKARLRQDVPLEGEEARVFLAEVSEVFLAMAPAALNEEEVFRRVIRLNGRYRRGVRTLLNGLAEPAADDAAVRERLAHVDYLKYRMRWDARVRGDVAALVAQPVAAETPLRYRAATLGERLELMGGLAASDWSEAVATLARIEEPYLRQKAAQLCFAARVASGVERRVAEDEVRLAAPEWMNGASANGTNAAKREG